jgi:hypothetical protein
MQAWWAAGTVMLTQGSSACACAGGTQRGASAMAATANAPISVLFISSPSPDPPMAAMLSPTPDTVQHLVVSDELRQVFLICIRLWAAPPPNKSRPPRRVTSTAVVMRFFKRRRNFGPCGVGDGAGRVCGGQTGCCSTFLGRTGVVASVTAPHGAGRDALDSSRPGSLLSLPNAERAYRLTNRGVGLTVSLPPLKRPRIAQLPLRRRLSDPEVPAELALRSVIGARLAIAHWVSLHCVIGRGSVDASLMGNGIGDAGTGIVGVCLCGWNPEGSQRYHRCRRRAD